MPVDEGANAGAVIQRNLILHARTGEPRERDPPLDRSRQSVPPERDILGADDDGQRAAGRSVGPAFAVGRKAVGKVRWQHVGRADEVGDKSRRRLVVDLARGGELLDPAFGHDGDPIADRQCLVLVVGHAHRRQADPFDDLAQFHLHGTAQLGIERVERFVHQQHLGVQNQRTGKRDALLLTAGQRLWKAIAEARQRNHVQRFGDTGLHRLAVHATHRQTVGNVFGHGHVREQRVVLEHEADVAAVRGERGHITASQANLAALRCLEAGNATQQGRFSAAGSAQKRDHLTRLDRQGTIAQHMVGAEIFVERGHLDHGLAP